MENKEVDNRPATGSEIQQVFEKGMQTAGAIMLDLFNLVKAKKFVQAGLESGDDLFIIRLHKVSAKELNNGELNTTVQSDDVIPAVK